MSSLYGLTSYFFRALPIRVVNNKITEIASKKTLQSMFFMTQIVIGLSLVAVQLMTTLTITKPAGTSTPNDLLPARPYYLRTCFRSDCP